MDSFGNILYSDDHRKKKEVLESNANKLGKQADNLQTAGEDIRSNSSNVNDNDRLQNKDKQGNKLQKNAEYTAANATRMQEEALDQKK